MPEGCIVLVVAVSENGVIGNGDIIPWRATPELIKRYRPDIEHFASITTPYEDGNNIVIMAWKTYETIPKKFRPLPNRLNWILSRSGYIPDEPAANLRIFNDFDNALQEARYQFPDRDIFIAGGAQIYQLAFEQKMVDIVKMTIIHGQWEGDKKLIGYNKDEWEETEREQHEYFTFVTYKYKR